MIKTTAFALLLLGCAALSAQPTLQITSPADDTVVRPGESLLVKVTPAGGPFEFIIINGSTELDLKGGVVRETLPYDFTVPIPANIAPGEYHLTAMGAAPGVEPVYADVFITVELASDPIALKVVGGSLSLWAGDTEALRVIGKIQHSSWIDMTLSKRLVFSSETPAVATVDSAGKVTAVAPGRGKILVGTTVKPMIEVPVTVAPYIDVVPPDPRLRASKTTQFLAHVNLRAGEAVTWTASPSGIGLLSPINARTVSYTAPPSVTTQQVITVQATSVVDPTKFKTATVTLLPPLAVTISPTVALLRAKQTQQFTANITNPTYTVGQLVTWSVTGIGAISATGLYTAPTPITADQTVVVKATSTQEPTKSASATVSLKKSR